MDLISEILDNPNKLSNIFNSSENDNSNSIGSNIVTIKCTKILFSKEGLKNNISSYILIIFITQFLISIILFIKCGYQLLEDKITKILYEKEKIAKKKKTKNQATNIDKNLNQTKHKNTYKGKNFNFPPKKHNLNFINNMNIERNNNNKNNNKYSNSNFEFNKKYISINTNVNDKNGKRKKKKTKKKKKKNNFLHRLIYKNEQLSFNDYELNNLNYNDAITCDKRSFIEYYFSLFKTKHIIFFSFCLLNDYNNIIIKLCILSLTFSIYYAINFSFFDDEMIHKLYESGGKYDIIYFMPKIIGSFVISYFISIILRLIFLSERNISQVRKQKILSLANDISFKVKRNLVIKYIIFFILGIVFLVFFWMLLSAFGAVYQNTQIIIFKNALISFAISLFFPFFINIFPCLFRMCSLNSGNSDKECLYNFSKFLQWL